MLYISNLTCILTYYSAAEPVSDTGGGVPSSGKRKAPEVPKTHHEIRKNMERGLHERDRVGVQDFVLLQNFESEDAFIDNLRKRFNENLIYVSKSSTKTFFFQEILRPITRKSDFTFFLYCLIVNNTCNLSKLLYLKSLIEMYMMKKWNLNLFIESLEILKSFR